jgi:hypothetical protein
MHPTREQYAKLLMGALVVRLSERGSIKEMLEDLYTVPQEELLEELVAEIEKFVGKRRLEEMVERSLQEVPTTKPPAKPVTPIIPLEPTRREIVNKATVHAPAEPLPPPPSPEDHPALKKEEHDHKERRAKPAATKHARPSQEKIPEPEPVPPPDRQEVRTPYEINEEDVIYLHALSMIPEGEESSPKPFMLEEKGLEGEFAYALDRAGLRFYLSTLRSIALNVGKTGVLLLGKSESIRLRGAHAGILNDLRVHGQLLPCEFGTVAMGRDNLFAMIDRHQDSLRDAMAKQAVTRWWNLSVFALDWRVAEVMASESPSARREREKGRESYTVGAHSAKLDIKALEKILNKEKKLAESIHDELQPLADRADIDMIVNLGSGSSEDWKPILRASYELPPSRHQWFCRTVTDLQYRHFLFELMLQLDGDREAFIFPKS